MAQSGGWGANFGGRLGIGNPQVAMLSKPTQIGVSGITAIATGSAHTLTLRNDGTVFAWGTNTNGEVGDGTTAARMAPVQIPTLRNITQVAAGGNVSFAVDRDSALWMWGAVKQSGGAIYTSTPVRVSGLTGVASVAAGNGFYFVTKTDGTVWAWGRNTEGELGDGTSISRDTAAMVPALAGLRRIAPGYQQSLGLRSDATLVAWGATAQGQLGTGQTSEIFTPVAAAKPVGADLIVSLPPAGPFLAGGKALLTIQVTNDGNGIASTGLITVTETLPQEMTYVFAEGAGWACSALDRTITCTSSAPIYQGRSSEISLLVNVAANAPASLVHSATVWNASDVYFSNNSAAAAVSILPPLDPNDPTRGGGHQHRRRLHAAAQDRRIPAGLGREQTPASSVTAP